MNKKDKKSSISWGRRYLTLDRYMSGSFMPIFLWTLALFLLAFIFIWIFAYFISGWSPGHMFIQLSNPSDGNSVWEWILIVLTNLFGLVVLNGVILTLLVNWVSNRKDRHERGEARYEYIFSKNFAVIIGAHEIVASLVRDLIIHKGFEYVLIQTQRDPLVVRREVEGAIDDEEYLKHVVIYSGNRTSWHELEELNLALAKDIYIIGEPTYLDKTSHDSINMQTWKLMNEHINMKLEKRIPCHIMFEYQSTFTAFQYTDLKLEESAAFRFIPFSIYENWAQQVLIPKIDKGESYYLPLDGESGLQYASPQRIHLIVIGMSKMGVAVAIEASHIAHYPNFNNPEVGKPRSLITFIDADAKREMTFFMGRFKELFHLARWRYVKASDSILPPLNKSWDIYDTIEEITEKTNKEYPWHDPMKDADFGSPYYGGYLGEDLVDIDFEFIEGDVSLPSIQKYISDACSDPLSKTTIAVSLPIAAESMAAALYFKSSVYEDAQQIWVYQNDSGALADAIRYGLTGKDNAKFKSLRPFGMIGQCDYLIRINSEMPKIVAYAYECLNNGTTLEEAYHKTGRKSDRIIEEAKNIWLNITQEGGKSAIAKRWSNIYCANSFDTKIRSLNIDLSLHRILEDSSVIENLAKVEHNRWVIEQLLLGILPVGKEYKDKLPIDDKEERNKLKQHGIHPDIISNTKLGKSQYYDVEIAKIIPLAYHIVNQDEFSE